MKNAIDENSKQIVSADNVRQGEFKCPSCWTNVYWKSSPGGNGRGYFTHGRLVATHCHHKDHDLLQEIAAQTGPSAIMNLPGYRRYMQRRRHLMEQIQEELNLFNKQVPQPEA